ncbi:reverse transcriptase [Plakobranchus ocellatus]|uniref:Reverse transcriptase n=1 Tax=Plakobranchus ocellatus TaxID=259542 RepID=A0AAV3XYY8_9GAST|nr:reverse transcriptase [Plakobranchus ocellatus]
MQEVLDNKKKSAPGKDAITYEIINQTPPSFKLKILALFNAIWISGDIPKQFKHAVVIPIYKQGKVLETIINKRLTYHLEANNLISDTQAGFRKDTQTLDQIVALENSVKAAKTNSRTVGAIFLDLEKAYDSMWREGLLMKLKKLGIKGLMYNYIANFNQDRTFQVRVGSSLSSLKNR